MPQLGATFVPGGADDYYMPEVVAPSPRRVTPQVPQNMQDDLRRLEIEPRGDQGRGPADAPFRHDQDPPPSRYTGSSPGQTAKSQHGPAADADFSAYQNNASRAQTLDKMGRDAPSFSPFPQIMSDNVPPGDDAKEEILWNAREHVLHSPDVNMQVSWARDALIWAEISMDAAAREPADRARAATPRIEHELRVDALNIINHLARQEHPDALYIRSKWLEFGKFGNRVDKREAFSGYQRAAELGSVRSEYRMGMLFEQSGDMSKAKEHYYRGMGMEDSAALYRMGMMSLLGQHGETKDYPKGLERIRAAADGADEDAPQGSYVYGMLAGRELPDISIPDGLLPYNLETAKMYVEKAAYLGFAKAQLKMGQAYELCQLGCELRPAYSLHYYGLAAKQGQPEAALGVSRWFLFGYEGAFKKNEELAFKYAQEAAAAKLPTGEFAMGYYYEIGIHIHQSIAEARRWYQMAADHGNKDAMGRLESLSQDKSLSKQDHETTTLTRIKSQHGSQRGKRPERFKQPQQMPTLSEGPVDEATRLSPRLPAKLSSSTASPRVSPQPSPGIRPTIVSEHTSFPDPSRASVVGLDRQSAWNVKGVDAASQPTRPRSAAPYPDDDEQPEALYMGRSRSTAPYPADDVGAPPNSEYKSGSRPYQGPQADRRMNAFDNKGPTVGPRPMPTSHSAGSLLALSPPPAGSRVASAGFGSPASGGFRQASPGLANAPGRPYANDDMQGRRSASGQAYPSASPVSNRMQKQAPRQPYGNLQGAQAPYPPAGVDPGREYGRRSSSRPASDVPPQQDPRATTQGHERFSRVPGAAGRPERLSSLPPQEFQRPQRMGSGPGQAPLPSARPGAGRSGSGHGPPHAATAPAKPTKGPATFEEMNIPQGKQEGDCVMM